MPSYTYAAQLGTFGSGDNQFNNAEQIDCDGTYIYVADDGNSRIKKHLLADLSFVAKVAVAGEMSMRGICTDGTHVYTIDSDFNSGSGFGRLQKWLCSDLSLVASVSNASTSGFNFPINCDTDGTYVYVANVFGSNVKKYNCSDLLLAATQNTYGTGVNGSGDNDLAGADGVTVDASHIYVSCDNTDRVTKMDKATGAYVTKYGSNGTGDNQIGDAARVKISDGGDGYLYVVDQSNDRIVVRNASDLSYVTQFGSSGSGNTQFDSPRGLWTNGSVLVVMDSGLNGRLVKYTVSSGAAPYTVINGTLAQLVNVNNAGVDVDAMSYKTGVQLTEAELATVASTAGVMVTADAPGPQLRLIPKRILSYLSG